MQVILKKKYKKENILQNQLKGFINPTNKKNHIENDKVLNAEANHIGIQLVRFDENNRRISSVKVAVSQFLAPISQSATIFD